jgi:spore germination cell wall hydrolase CwlJ-like protein
MPRAKPRRLPLSAVGPAAVAAGDPAAADVLVAAALLTLDAPPLLPLVVGCVQQRSSTLQGCAVTPASTKTKNRLC